MTWDGSTIRFYVNGTLDNQMNAGPSEVLHVPGFDVGIGRHPMFGTRGFHGLIDEPSLYSQALSAAEIAAIYAAGSAGKCSPAADLCTTPVPEMTHHWTGDGNVTDEVGSLHSVLESGANYDGGLVGQAFYFENGGLARIPEDPSLQPMNFTFEAWIYAMDVGTLPDIAGPVIVSRDISVAPTITYAIAGPGTTGHFTASVGLTGGASMGVTSTYTYGFNRWHHVAMTWDGIAVRFYVNGRLDNQAVAPALPLNYDGSGEVGIGRHPKFGTRGFHGLIDEPTFYSRALTASEINAIVIARGGGKCLPQPEACVASPVTPVHWWRGENTEDDHVGSLDAVPVGTVGYLPGRVGQAFNFTANGMLRVPSDPSINLQQFSFEAWVNARSVGSLADTVGAIIASKDTTVSAPGITFSITGPGTTGRFRASVGLDNGTDPAVFSTNPFGFNTWHHVCMTWDGSQLVLYVNGAVEGSSVLGPQTVFSSDTDIGIGRHAFFGTRAYDGLIDEPTLFDRALTSQEVLSLYQAGDQGKCPEVIPPGATVVELRDSLHALIQNSGATLEYQPNSTGAYLPFGDGAMDAGGREWALLLTGIHRFRLTYQDMSVTLQQNTANDPVVTFETLLVAVQLRDSQGQLLSGSNTALVDWQSGSSGNYAAFGNRTLDPNANVFAEILSGLHRFRLTFQDMTYTLQQDVALDPIVRFATTNVVVQLRSSQDQVLFDTTSASVEWQSGSSGAYAAFGNPTLDANGNASMEVLPGIHRFRLTYQDMTQLMQTDVALQQTVLFSTRLVQVQLRGSLGQTLPDAAVAVDWQSGSSGNYAPFGLGSLDANGDALLEVLPGIHRFRINFQDALWTEQREVGTDTLVPFVTVPSSISLVDSANQPILGATATLSWQSGSSGNYAPYATGSLDPSATSSMEVVPQLHRYRMTYQGVPVYRQQNPATQPGAVFQTAAVGVEIRNSTTGQLILNSNALVSWQPASTGAYVPFGVDGVMDANGTEAQELLPHTHRFRITYGGVTKTVQHAITGNAVVTLSFP